VETKPKRDPVLLRPKAERSEGGPVSSVREKNNKALEAMADGVVENLRLDLFDESIKAVDRAHTLGFKTAIDMLRERAKETGNSDYTRAADYLAARLEEA
jgi:hypothetical protein